MSDTAELEGVIRFHIDHQSHILSTTYSSFAQELSAWRYLFKKLEILGQSPNRYQGVGYGNMSTRINRTAQAVGTRSFLITGSQTGSMAQLSLAHYTLVEHYQINTHTLQSRGEILPSSESMTHAALYDLNPEIYYVFHVHAPLIWKFANQLHLPCTPDKVSYGTMDMVRAVQNLYQQGAFNLGQVLVMGGHEDGVICCGQTAQQAGHALVQSLINAHIYQSSSD